MSLHAINYQYIPRSFKVIALFTIELWTGIFIKIPTNWQLYWIDLVNISACQKLSKKSKLFKRESDFLQTDHGIPDVLLSDFQMTLLQVKKLVKTFQRRHLKITYTIYSIYIAQWKGQITLTGQNVDSNWKWKVLLLSSHIVRFSC